VDLPRLCGGSIGLWPNTDGKSETGFFWAGKFVADYDLSKVRVLIVDDHEPMRQILTAMLKALGIRDIGCAEDGREAVKLLAKIENDLIITDLGLPFVDGFELTQSIRSGEAGGDPFVPIIMLSGDASRENIFKARDAGISEFLAKPVSARDLYMRIRRIIEHPRLFIRARHFFGPDRRRRALEFDSPERRKKEYAYPA
jgi:DNA-binding response OmpR family regulator